MPCNKLKSALRLNDKVKPDIENKTSDLTLVQKENNGCAIAFEITIVISKFTMPENPVLLLRCEFGIRSELYIL